MASIKNTDPPKFELTNITIDEVWSAFAAIQKLTDTFETVEEACYLTLGEFAAENVKYIESMGSTRN